MAWDDLAKCLVFFKVGKALAINLNKNRTDFTIIPAVFFKKNRQLSKENHFGSAIVHIYKKKETVRQAVVFHYFWFGKSLEVPDYLFESPNKI